MDLDALEEIDTLAHGGADTFAVADLDRYARHPSSTSASLPASAHQGGDGRGADRVSITAAGAVRVAGSRGTARVTGFWPPT